MMKWKLMITTLPVPLVVIIIRFLLESVFYSSGREFSGIIDFTALSPILTGGVFLIGLMLSGTLQDYKESEKIPAEIACSIETIEETVTWVAANRPAVAERAMKKLIADMTAAILAWLYRTRTQEECYASIERLNDLVRDFDKINAGLPANRMMNEIHALRKIITRVGVISRTGFLASGYALLDILVASILALLIASNYKADFGILGKYIILGFVSLIYSYLWRLLRDVDDPFEYAPDGQRTGAAEVELFPLLEYQQRALVRLAALTATEDRPSAVQAEEGAATKASAVVHAGASQRTGRLLLFAGAGVAALLLLAGGAWLRAQPVGSKGRVAVHWSIVSTPAGAEVLAADGKVLGKTPLSSDGGLAPGAQVLTVRLAGYAPMTVTCRGEADCQSTLMLAAIPGGPAVAVPAAAAVEGKATTTAAQVAPAGEVGRDTARAPAAGSGEASGAEPDADKPKTHRHHRRHHSGGDAASGTPGLSYQM